MSINPLQAAEVYQNIRRTLLEARQTAYQQVNSIMVQAYWQIGRHIVEEEQLGQERAGYGESLIRELSRQLGEEFGKGFSVANLKNFRQFYLTYKSYTLCSQLSWSHNRLIMREKSEAARYSGPHISDNSLKWCLQQKRSRQ